VKQTKTTTDVILLHDSTRPHTARLNVDILGLDVLPHPPNSPDLAPSDCHLFGPMKKMLGGQTEICPRNGGTMGQSSVACAAADFIFCTGHSQTC